ncbi:MAG TPA: RlmE family RNA methyltransferase [Gemmatimonadaceae bacterium]|nr:RlmE family RNA methyltransferase [Gemmatimonadaceae bacterium]
MAKSSKQWLQRHVTDPYVRKAKEQGYRSRAAFKLLEMDAKERFLRPGAVVLDLGAAPGGWSQVAAAKVKPHGKVLAIDVLPIAPIPGVTIVKGDFRDLPETDKADLVLSDLSPNMSGIGSVDQARSLDLALGAVDVCRKLLKPEGVFVTKAFHGEAFDDLKAELDSAFLQVKVHKPAASRGESRETYFVCRALRKQPHD